MKKFVMTWIIGLGVGAVPSVWAGDLPGGRLLELHSCEVYAGGCKVSSEATLGGRYMLRVWDFSRGAYAGSPLRGLQAAVLEIADGNLAQEGVDSSGAVVYLPAAATASQRESLLAWLKATQPELSRSTCRSRIVPLHYSQNDLNAAFSAGRFVKVETAAREACPTGGCGEQLWYKPRTLTSVFTVAVDQTSEVDEPLLQLKWSDSGRPTVFLGWFGEGTRPQNAFIDSPVMY